MIRRAIALAIAVVASLVGGGMLATPAFAAAPANTTPPSISGTPAEQSALTETAGIWTGAATVTVSWQRCPDNTGTGCTAISGSPTTTGSSYTPVAADVGKYIMVVETADDGTGATATKNSNLLGPVTATAPTNNSAPPL